MDKEETIHEIAAKYDYGVSDITHNELEGDAADQWIITLENDETFKICDTALYKVEVEAQIRRIDDQD